ncbi:MAG: tRNA preQ1(34) S-adenosylmethionine ribosyltransferase-isomerase QueA [Cyanobium sp.]
MSKDPLLPLATAVIEENPAGVPADPLDLLLSSYDYALPDGFIAQRPVEPRHAARLLVVDPAAPRADATAVLQGGSAPVLPCSCTAAATATSDALAPVHALAQHGPCRHRTVWDLAEELRPGDLLVVNDTRVLKARLRARRATGGAVELLVLEPAALTGLKPEVANAEGAAAEGAAAEANRRSFDPSDWLCLARPAKRLRPGDVVQLEHPGQPPLALQVMAADGETGGRVVRFPPECTSPEAIEALLARYGEMPLPPYIHEHDASDEERYQTRYAERPGSVAAPTAGLHLSDELLERLRERGVPIAAVTLHVGLGTFRPVDQEDLRDLELHSEWVQVRPEAVAAVQACRARGGRVIAVGTTSVRTLEAVAALHGGELRPHSGAVNLVIQPGHRFAVVQGLLTNFHLPKSSLLLLVSALIGRQRLLALYEEAKAQGYRFFSYGDAMWIAPEAVLTGARR